MKKESFLFERWPRFAYRHARLVLLGTGMERASLDGVRIILNELEITGAYNYDESGFVAALELLAEGVPQI